MEGEIRLDNKQIKILTNIEKDFLKPKQKEIKKEEYQSPRMLWQETKDWSRAVFGDIINQRVLLMAFIGFSGEQQHTIFLTPRKRILTAKEKVALLLNIGEEEGFVENKAPYFSDSDAFKVISDWKKEHNIHHTIGIAVTEKGIFKSALKGVMLHDLALYMYQNHFSH